MKESGRTVQQVESVIPVREDRRIRIEVDLLEDFGEIIFEQRQVTQRALLLVTACFHYTSVTRSLGRADFARGIIRLVAGGFRLRRDFADLGTTTLHSVERTAAVV